MTLVYYILTVILSSIATLIVPDMVAHIRRLKTEKKHKLQALIRAEVEQQLKQILND